MPLDYACSMAPPSMPSRYPPSAPLPLCAAELVRSFESLFKPHKFGSAIEMPRIEMREEDALERLYGKNTSARIQQISVSLTD
jgi:hypothetical protein